MGSIYSLTIVSVIYLLPSNQTTNKELFGNYLIIQNRHNEMISLNKFVSIYQYQAIQNYSHKRTTVIGLEFLAHKYPKEIKSIPITSKVFNLTIEASRL